ncbi:hypothetical protein [Streptomyces sp. XY533]|uniref:hypothetical protein n=1 Tax=Streptomyces sp. XY533 TaxID=1519481 RepID=UPI0006AE3ED2|nr:hypothetical protein [Streptomyces sp. XY533]KOU99096.1 hypothetical protein ADK92_12900 [Streptomyces sp. XY533]
MHAHTVFAAATTTAVADTWRALLTGPWTHTMPVELRRGRFLLVAYVAAGLADATGRIPDPADATEPLTDRLARDCATRPESVARILSAATAAGALTEPAPGRYALDTTAVPDWAAALDHLTLTTAP